MSLSNWRDIYPAWRYESWALKMRTTVLILTVSAFALAPVTLLALFRSVSVATPFEHIVFVPVTNSVCPATQLWKVKS
jgi:hypothetical protein